MSKCYADAAEEAAGHQRWILPVHLGPPIEVCGA